MIFFKLPWSIGKRESTPSVHVCSVSRLLWTVKDLACILKYALKSQTRKYCQLGVLGRRSRRLLTFRWISPGDSDSTTVTIRQNRYLVSIHFAFNSIANEISLNYVPFLTSSVAALRRQFLVKKMFLWKWRCD